MEISSPWRSVHNGDQFTMEIRSLQRSVRYGDEFAMEISSPWRSVHHGDQFTTEISSLWRSARVSMVIYGERRWSCLEEIEFEGEGQRKKLRKNYMHEAG